MRLPEIADRLRLIALRYDDDEIMQLAEAMRRRTSTRAKPTSERMTPELRQRIRDYARAHPGQPRAAIAQIFNVNPGRVSEAVRGKRQ